MTKAMIKIADALPEDLQGILDLQRKNLKSSLSAEEITKEGFTTLEHSVELLRKMNSPYPHTIALSDHQVVGYALTLMPSLEAEFPDLRSMFDEVRGIESYVVMGQICIDKAYRSQGIFRSMYKGMKMKFQGIVDYIVTEVAVENVRSMNAHLAIGFKEYKIKKKWSIILLKINK